MIADNDVDYIMQEGMTFTVGMSFAVIFIAEANIHICMYSYILKLDVY